MVTVTFLRASASTIALVTIYYLLPLVLVTIQVRLIIRAEHPALRGVGALATSAPMFLLLFAATYFLIAGISPDSFSQLLTRTDALYFTVTVFATVGFGDIVPTTELTRVLVIGQMVADIVIVGAGARIIVDAIKHGGEQQPVPGAQCDPQKRSAAPLSC